MCVPCVQVCQCVVGYYSREHQENKVGVFSCLFFFFSFISAYHTAHCRLLQGHNIEKVLGLTFCRTYLSIVEICRFYTNFFPEVHVSAKVLLVIRKRSEGNDVTLQAHHLSLSLKPHSLVFTQQINCDNSRLMLLTKNL